MDYEHDRFTGIHRHDRRTVSLAAQTNRVDGAAVVDLDFDPRGFHYGEPLSAQLRLVDLVRTTLALVRECHDDAQARTMIIGFQAEESSD